MTRKMKALVLEGPMQYDIQEVPIPECPDGGMLLKVIACGLCGSDLRTLKNGRKNMNYPWTLGHEISAVVEEIGCNFKGQWKTGDLLAVAPMVYCGACEFCEAGTYELCENSREIAHQWPGGFAEYVAIPEEAIVNGTIQYIPEGMDPVIASVAEPASSCVNAQEKASVGLGDTVVIIGSGPIGCIHVSIAKARGARKVIASDISDERLARCVSFGADHVVNSLKADLMEEVRRLTDGRGPDVVITANPVGQTQVQAVEMAKKGARIVLFGGLPHDASKPGIDTNLIHYKGLHLVGTTTFAPRHNRLSLQLLESGRIPGDKLVTHVLPLTEFKQGVKLATEGTALKVVFKP